MVDYATMLGQLDEVGRTQPALAAQLALPRAILALQAQVDPTIVTVSYPAGFSAGRSALSAAVVHADGAALVQFALQVIDATRRRRPDLDPKLLAVERWLAAGVHDLPALISTLPASDGAALAATRGVDLPLLLFIMNNTLRPFLRVHAERMATAFDERVWYRGRCPFCGGAPDFAALMLESGERRQLCSWCDGEWPFYRTTCPFCDSDAGTGYYQHGRAYRIYVCEVCKHYIKTVDRRETTERRALPVERIVTIDADASALAARWLPASETSGRQAASAFR